MFGLRHGRRRWYRSRKKPENRRSLTAADLRVNEQATVKALVTTSPEHLTKLMALGILPGTKLTVVQRSPSLVLQMGETMLAVDETVAQLIEVE
ncbi:MAG: ferrous iron transport protein A [Firmicutes bacterium]|jgi:ferrous iron transport protein A|nr:ferrous iron transport protein A [Bacillota bacterium]